ncbi:MAG: hypothetical protein H0T65_13310 [Deltaproteobacteria bacterium]|nr:hypothetical protein [Deltaproteobacteria bacterium]
MAGVGKRDASMPCMAITRETIIERRQPQLRWGAVLGGAALTLGIWITLQVLGLGIGLASVETDDAGTLERAGIGTGIWSLIAPLIAMFLGGLLAGRLAATRERKVGAMHGSVVWAIALAIGLWMMMSLVSSFVGTATRAAGAVASGAARAGASVNPGDAMQALGVDANDLLGPINQRLAREGKPAITARELSATVRAVAQKGLRQGKLDQQILVEELARNTDLTRADAQEIASQYGDRFQKMASNIGEDVKHVALEAADKTGKALTMAAIMMLLSLGAAIAGGAVGVRRRDEDERTRRAPHMPSAVTHTPPPYAP